MDRVVKKLKQMEEGLTYAQGQYLLRYAKHAEYAKHGPDGVAALILAMPDETTCDACGEAITDDQKNVGHECDLHEGCAGE
jgi:hypothetical protein